MASASEAEPVTPNEPIPDEAVDPDEPLVPLAAGLSASVTRQVDVADTAIEIGSGDVAVLGTPRLIAWCEQATVAATADSMAPRTTSVALQIQIDHVAPSPVGRSVTAEATLEKVVGRKLLYTVAARDEHGLVAAGKVTRVVVDRDRFLARCAG